MKRLAIGIDDFRKIIKEDCYYVDKTKFIKAVLEDASNVKLFTRPRRFGKTLNMSMLKYFFDVRDSEENRKLFNGLDIEKSRYINEQGKYPTILISLKSIKYETWEESLEQLKSLLSNLYNEFEYIRECLNESEIELFNDIWFKKENGEYANSLKNLTSFLYKYYKKEVVLLIDEYDIPLITAHKYGYYNEIINFYKIFLGEALKTNQYLKMGVLTGIIRVIKTGIFSDLNNLKVYSILEKKYSEFFGFTEEEVKKALQYFNIEEELTNVKYWYDGYKFGISELYNPWSIINFLDGRELKNYWVGTSENFLIKNILENSTSRTNEILDKLFNEEEVEEAITGTSDLSILMDSKEVWELLLFSGYLTVKEKLDDDIYSLKLPNMEVKKLFKKEFINVHFGISLFRKTMEALKNLNFNDFEKYFQEIMLKSTSNWDTSKEAFYHGLSLGMLSYLDNDYYVTSNFEAGFGRYDVLLEPKNRNDRAFILEFKVAEAENKLEKLSKEAIKQIEEKKYDINLKSKEIKEITSVGIAFYGKKLKVSYK
ncbi:AAA family ATPase [Fusobacterium pseudoperiodonticum]|uniref:AAA family ATPase n=1 Tax=Fusobacterium pseudoperiodonticum TaxID=2663009 RepID=UPI0028D417DF|nr:AAA family ATPase [Fusobacterium pseudoperiodonticum]